VELFRPTCTSRGASGAQGAEVGGKLLSEGVKVGNKRHNPVDEEGVRDVSLLPTGHVGRGKVDAFHGSGFLTRLPSHRSVQSVHHRSRLASSRSGFAPLTYGRMGRGDDRGENERMGIQQRFHDSKASSISSGRGASKSGAIQICPCALLATRGHGAGAKGTRRATGFPALAMTTSSPMLIRCSN
jgi:hypothetical protein